MTIDKIQAARDWRARWTDPTRFLAREQAKPNLAVKAAGPDTTEILIYDEIGGWGISSQSFIAALASITTPSIRVRLNSPGGDVFEGYAIYNALKAHRSQVTCVVDGLAASSASLIALAGDTLAMCEPSLLMIHRAWTFAMGNTNDMQKCVDILAKVDGQLAGVYAAKSGKPDAEMLALMDAETWLTPAEAMTLGLADGVLADPPATEEDDEDPHKLEDALLHEARLRAAAVVRIGRR